MLTGLWATLVCIQVAAGMFFTASRFRDEEIDAMPCQGCARARRDVVAALRRGKAVEALRAARRGISAAASNHVAKSVARRMKKAR